MKMNPQSNLAGFIDESSNRPGCSAVAGLAVRQLDIKLNIHIYTHKRISEQGDASKWDISSVCVRVSVCLCVCACVCVCVCVSFFVILSSNFSS